MSYLESSLENFHPLCQMPSHADVLNSVHCCAGLTQTAPNFRTQHTQKLRLIYWFHIKNILTFFWFFWKFCLPTFFGFFLATSLILMTFLLLWPFSWHFRLVSPVTCAEIPFCAKNSATLMSQVQCRPYYARHTPKILGAIMLLHRAYLA